MPLGLVRDKIVDGHHRLRMPSGRTQGQPSIAEEGDCRLKRPGEAGPGEVLHMFGLREDYEIQILPDHDVEQAFLPAATGVEVEIVGRHAVDFRETFQRQEMAPASSLTYRLEWLLARVHERDFWSFVMP